MRIYFDICSLNRPLDDKTQLRVSLEAEAVLGMMARCESGTDMLVSSDALVLENERNSNLESRAFVTGILDQAARFISIDAAISRRARELEERGFSAFDALHVASAEGGAVDCLCTCDDRLLKKSRRQSDLSIRVLSPLELANEVSI